MDACKECDQIRFSVKEGAKLLVFLLSKIGQKMGYFQTLSWKIFRKTLNYVNLMSKDVIMINDAKTALGVMQKQ